jgi:hypothetical protein
MWFGGPFTPIVLKKNAKGRDELVIGWFCAATVATFP